MTKANSVRMAGEILAEGRRCNEIFGPAREGFGEQSCRVSFRCMESRRLARHDVMADHVQLTDQGRRQMVAYRESARVPA